MSATVSDANQTLVVAEVRELKAFVSPAEGKYTVIYPELMQFASPSLQDIWARVSKKLKVAIIVTSVYDDDTLQYELWKNGELVDHYESDPSAMGDESKPDTPQGGNPNLLCATYHCTDESKIKTILYLSHIDKKYVFETDRHKDLAASLGLPGISVGYGYEYINQGEIPPGLTKSQLVKLPSK